MLMFGNRCAFASFCSMQIKYNVKKVIIWTIFFAIQVESAFLSILLITKVCFN